MGSSGAGATRVEAKPGWNGNGLALPAVRVEELKEWRKYKNCDRAECEALGVGSLSAGGAWVGAPVAAARSSLSFQF